jgi:hypothetical protein
MSTCEFLIKNTLYKMSKIYDWFEERLEIQSIADDITKICTASCKYFLPV